MTRLAVILMLVLLTMDRASAHEFSLGVHAFGNDARDRVVSAVRGILLAADERDGHSGETSDGHLGGVDVHIVPFLEDRAVALPELKNVHRGHIDLLLILESDTDPSVTLPRITDQTIVLGPGELPDLPSWSNAKDALSFAARYGDAWSTEPDIFSAQGYNAARRIDQAIRPHDGIEQTNAIRNSLLQSAKGVDWQ